GTPRRDPAGAFGLGIDDVSKASELLADFAHAVDRLAEACERVAADATGDALLRDCLIQRLLRARLEGDPVGGRHRGCRPAQSEDRAGPHQARSWSTANAAIVPKKAR